MGPDEPKKSAGWWVGWVGVPALLLGGAGTAIVKGVTSGNTPAAVAGGGAIAALGFILWRRFSGR